MVVDSSHWRGVHSSDSGLGLGYPVHLDALGPPQHLLAAASQLVLLEQERPWNEKRISKMEQVNKNESPELSSRTPFLIV